MTHTYLGQVQNLDWASPSRIFASTTELFDSQPNYEHEVAIALDTRIKYQGVAPVVGGWGYASGAPGPGLPVPPVPVNDSFTKILLEFDGAEGSTTYYDTNRAGMPRKWTQRSGLGHITNIGEKFYSGALWLDGKTVITAPDSVAFDFWMRDFTIRGWFLCDFPVGMRRTLAGKSDQANVKYVFWLDRNELGHFEAGVDTSTVLDNTIMDRNATRILDRGGNYVVTRFAPAGGAGRYFLESETVYSDTNRTGWHEFKFTRSSGVLRLVMDGVEEDNNAIGSEVVNTLPGPITIGGYGPPVNGVYQSLPWIGGLDRFAVDIGIAR